MELKQRRSAAGRAGAWGWKIRGTGFNGITSGHVSAQVRRESTDTAKILEIRNKRPGMGAFVTKKEYIQEALAAVVGDMKIYIERKLSKRLL
jgi:hypothetical protein